MGKPRRKVWTAEEFFRIPEDELRRYELLDGELVVSALPATAHQFVQGQVFLLLMSWSQSRSGGLVLQTVDIHLADDVVVGPDVLWIAPGREAVVNDLRLVGIPDLVVEILSPSTARRDRTKKAGIYARHGCREYWLLDPRTRTVEIFTLGSGALVPHAAGRSSTPLVSTLDPALVVIPDALFSSMPACLVPQPRKRR